MSTATIDLAGRPAPALGGFNGKVLGIELRRMLRNRRTMIFTLAFPVLMFFLVSNGSSEMSASLVPGGVATVSTYVLISMAVYGAAMATTTGGAAVSVERASGWSRQLLLTPLSPTAYVVMKMITALVLGLTALVASFVVSGLSGRAPMTWDMRIESGAIILVGSLVFAAFGLFMGYLIPSDNVMQILGPGMAILGFLGGLFQGPIDTASIIGKVQMCSPIYGLNQIAHWPITAGPGGRESFDVMWVVNLLVWAVIFTAGAVWRFRKDTARV